MAALSPRESRWRLGGLLSANISDIHTSKSVNELGREQFREAMRLEPSDLRVAMEYALLYYETKEQAPARRIFDRIRQTGNAVAEQAFHNIDIR